MGDKPDLNLSIHKINADLIIAKQEQLEKIQKEIDELTKENKNLKNTK